ncbi:DUF421 domain-containing protein [Ilumatobacter nonamiensis]|uniref:DUF421 domain-containing protein n=1 Tax=Ilumatobacter nonamiensis TaxID=467093 RepID=UPI00034A33AE|nr:YetF domain-containing protein [Ilumatobacter nonamiensis]
MIAGWVWSSWSDVGTVIVSAVVMMAAVITIIRVVGLRSLSKMSSFDFAVTVAIGSITASTVASSTPLANGAVAVASLLAVQAVIAVLRRRASFDRVVDNTPVLLMRDGMMIDEAMSRCRVTEADVIAKLREANALELSSVRAVVLETTGDISVLHGEGPLDPLLLRDVRDLR